jgi:hypothetical protein
MPPRQRKYSPEEHARRGEAIYQQIRPLVEAGNHGKIVAIDIDSGAFEVGDNEVAADTPLLARFPDAQVWYVRIGYPAVHRFSYVPRENAP